MQVQAKIVKMKKTLKKRKKLNYEKEYYLQIFKTICFYIALKLKYVFQSLHRNQEKRLPRIHETSTGLFVFSASAI